VERRWSLDRYAADIREKLTMLMTIAIILLVLWALGFFAFHVAGGLIHLLLVIGVIVLIWNFVAGRRAV
jgi:membrane-bound ClpP family serine protease